MMFYLSYFRLGKITTDDSEPQATSLYSLIEVLTQSQALWYSDYSFCVIFMSSMKPCSNDELSWALMMLGFALNGLGNCMSEGFI